MELLLTVQDVSNTWRERTELSQAKARATSRQLILAELLRHDDDVATGAAEVLADRWAPMFDYARPEVIADYIRRHLSDPDILRLSRAHGRRAGDPIEQGDIRCRVG